MGVLGRTVPTTWPGSARIRRAKLTLCVGGLPGIRENLAPRGRRLSGFRHNPPDSDAQPGKLPIAGIQAGRQTGPKLTTGTEKWKSSTSSKPWISKHLTPPISMSWPFGSMSRPSAQPPPCWSAPGTISSRHPARLELAAGEPGSSRPRRRQPVSSRCCHSSP